MADDFDPTQIAWVMSKADLRHLLVAIEEAGEVTFDLETTGLDEHAVRGGATNGGVAARVVLASYTLTDGSTWVVPLSHPDSPFHASWRAVLRVISRRFERHRVGLIAHNAKFDCRWVHATTGVDLAPLVVWDTQVSSHLLDETRSTRLKERAPATFDVDRWDDFDLTYPGAAEEVPLFDLGIYAARDTYWTHRLLHNHRLRMHIDTDEHPVTPDEIEDARLGNVARFVSMPAVRTLAAAEQRGMLLDREWVAEAITEHEVDLAEVTERLSGFYPVDGPPSFAPTSTWFSRWSQAATEAGDLEVTAMTPTGKPQWSKEVLMRQSRHGSTVATDLLGLRGLTKRLEYLRSWTEVADPEGYVHATYNIARTRSGRLSSADPNLQQVTKMLKPAFVPSPGHVFVDLDFSQIELRVAAFISRCEPMIDAFQRGDDLHRLLAARVSGIHPDDVTKEQRQAGKAGNFGLLYGMSAGGFRDYAENAYDVAMSEEESVEMRQVFFDLWTGLDQWHLKTMSRVRQTGQVVSPIGRVRRLPEVWDANDYLVGKAERSAINSPVQGFASDLMQMSAASISGLLSGSSPAVSGARMVGTVHDSVLIEVPRETAIQTAEECRQRMVTVADEVRRRFRLDFDVPLDVEGEIGTRWGLDDLASLPDDL